MTLVIAVPLLVLADLQLWQLLLSQPIEVVGVLLGLVLLALVLWRPYWALIVFFALNPFNLMLATAMLGLAHHPLGLLSNWKDALLVALLVRGTIDRLPGHGLKLPHGAADRFLVWFVVVHVLLLGFAPDLVAGIYGLARHIEGPLLLLAIIALRPPRPVIKACIAAILLGVLVMSLGAIVERGPQENFQTWWGGFPPAPQSSSFTGFNHFYRSGSFFGTPLLLGFYLAAATPLALALTGLPRQRLRMMAVVAVGLSAVALLLTVTRTAYIGGMLGVIVAATLALRRGWRFFILWTAVGASCFAILAAATGFALLTKPDEGNVHANSLATDITLVLDQPLLGYGMGTTDAVRYRFQSTVLPGASESNYMAKALELGIPGLLLYLAALYVVGKRLRDARQQALARGDADGAVLAAGALGALIGLAGAGLFIGTFELAVDAIAWGSAGLAISAVEGLAPTKLAIAARAGVVATPAYGRALISGGD